MKRGYTLRASRCRGVRGQRLSVDALVAAGNKGKRTGRRLPAINRNSGKSLANVAEALSGRTMLTASTALRWCDKDALLVKVTQRGFTMKPLSLRVLQLFGEMG